MKQENLVFKSSDGIHDLHAKLWLPAGEVKGVIQIVHGMNEYIGRYANFAGFMTAHGFAVGGDDHLGHGTSAVNSDELGWFGDNNGAGYLTEDEHLFYNVLRSRFPDCPYFLLGHSMGSFISRNYVAHFEDELTGYICMGTAGRNPALSMAKTLSALIRTVRGPRYRSEFLKKLSFSGYNDAFKDEKDPNSWLSRNERDRIDYAADPWTQFTFTTAAYQDLFNLLGEVTGSQWASKIRKNLPILIVSGDMDPVGSNGKGPKEVYSWLKSEGMEDVTLKLFRGARHEILNENNRHEVYDYLLNWMEEVKNRQSQAV